MAPTVQPARFRSVAVRVAVVVPFLAVLALSGWEGVSNRDSGVAHVGVIVIVAAAVLVMIVAGVLRRRAAAAAPEDDAEDDAATSAPSRAMVLGSAVWVVLFAAIVAWDAFSFSQQSPGNPTLSQEIGHITQFDVGRAVAFALWVAAGWLIATARPRR